VGLLLQGRGVVVMVDLIPPHVQAVLARARGARTLPATVNLEEVLVTAAVEGVLVMMATEGRLLAVRGLVLAATRVMAAVVTTA
jgi:hypothetical protein